MSNISSDGLNDLVFIGGGATGAALIITLAKKAQDTRLSLEGRTIHLFDPKGFGNGGIAYGDCHQSHLLNSVRTEMSPWDPEAYHNYCKEQGLSDDALTFETRVHYQEFLERELEQALRTLESLGATIKEHQVEATIEKPDIPGQFNILDTESNHILKGIPPESIHLAMGYGSNENFPRLREEFGKRAGYIHSIYGEGLHAVRELVSNRPDQHLSIAVAGPGAALQDLINQSSRAPSITDLFVFAGSGEPLGTRDVSLERDGDRHHYKPQFLDEEIDGATTADELAVMVKREFSNAQESGFSERRAGLDIMKELGAYLERMSASAARDFRRKYASHFMHLATPVPEQSNEILRSFDPHIISHRLDETAVKRTNDQFKIATGDTTISADIIINLTGHGRLPALARKLLRSDIAQCNAHLGILQTDKTGYVLTGSRMRAFGPPVHFGIDGMESFFGPIETAIGDLVGQLNSSQAPNCITTGTIHTAGFPPTPAVAMR